MNWHTETRKINDLIPHPENPRQMSEKQVADLTESLNKFNLVEIPAINLDNTILAGHQRLKILSLLGRGEEIIDVRVPDRMLSEDEAQEYLLRSNHNIGSWDWDMLANISEDLLKEVGFSEDEMSILTGMKIDDLVDTQEVDISRFDVIMVDGPNSPKLKNRRGFYFDTIEQFEEVVEYFKTNTEYKLDGVKLLEFLKK